ncbi:MAG TPA: hypothetical protein VMF61_09480 [Candidatus Acidoferrales bacterium]|nr:hypothetical protein [Candidatus Acidoferrales bacterium]
MTAFDPAQAIADAVLYEGYLLYPYTASALKNKMRWQFGVLVPRERALAGTGEHASLQAEAIARLGGRAQVTVRVRFLQVQARSVEAYDEETGEFAAVAALTVGSEDYTSFDEAVPREIDVAAALDAGEVLAPFEFPGGVETAEVVDASGKLRGRVLRRRWPLAGSIRLAATPVADGRVKVRVRVFNDSAVVAAPDRTSALRTAFLSTHLLLHVERGAFLSLLDPPDADAALVAACANERVFPVLVGDQRDDAHAAELVLASPIVLYDFPKVASQSRGDTFDGTEIDELLNLSVLSLSEAERREARATDPAARAIVERAEALDAQLLRELHGVLHAAEPEPGSESVVIDGVRVEKGARVRLHPKRRADVWDEFVDGKEAHVAGVYRDMEDRLHVAVTVDDDPATEFHAWYGRALFFACDEIEPLEEARQ